MDIRYRRSWIRALRGANSPLPHCGCSPGKAPTRIRSLRGANSPLPHCGGLAWVPDPSAVFLRGANSPLPHCGPSSSARPPKISPSTRGEFAPPSLRHIGCRRGPGQDGPTRGEFAPPSLRLSRVSAVVDLLADYEGRIRPSLIAAAADRLGRTGRANLRGANSPLPHCGAKDKVDAFAEFRTTRGEFAPPSLRR